MSEETKKGTRRYIGKVRNMNGNNGPYQKIYLDNLNELNPDGTPNTYYKGNLVWFDQATGERFLVKQISFTVPREGMKADQLQKGFVSFITINVEDEFDVDKLP